MLLYESTKLLTSLLLALILILALEYSNYSTEKRLEYEREKAEERLELSKLKDSIEIKKD